MPVPELKLSILDVKCTDATGTRYVVEMADNLEVIPPGLQEAPYTEALEIARVSSFTEGEWNAYDRALMAEQDARRGAAAGPSLRPSGRSPGRPR